MKLVKRNIIIEVEVIELFVVNNIQVHTFIRLQIVNC